MYSLPLSAAEPDRLSGLMEDLAQADEVSAKQLVREIELEWSKSGSAAMDLLLQRGRDALEAKEFGKAAQHLRALTDHAPEFAEGWQLLALAYFNQQRFGLAVDAIERVLALNPQHFGALRGLGAILEQVQKPELAFKAYSKVLELHPNDAEVQKAVERLKDRVSGTTL